MPNSEESWGVVFVRAMDFSWCVVCLGARVTYLVGEYIKNLLVSIFKLCFEFHEVIIVCALRLRLSTGLGRLSFPHIAYLHANTSSLLSTVSIKFRTPSLILVERVVNHDAA